MQLMKHSSGFEPNLAGGDFRTLERDQFLALAFASKLIYAPGQGERYSNLGYSMLAAVIEVVTGDSYGTFLQKNIWQPLHMDYTGLLFPKYDTAAMAHGYSGSQDEGRCSTSRTRRTVRTGICAATAATCRPWTRCTTSTMCCSTRIRCCGRRSATSSSRRTSR